MPGRPRCSPSVPHLGRMAPTGDQVPSSGQVENCRIFHHQTCHFQITKTGTLFLSRGRKKNFLPSSCISPTPSFCSQSQGPCPLPCTAQFSYWNGLPPYLQGWGSGLNLSGSQPPRTEWHPTSTPSTTQCKEAGSRETAWLAQGCTAERRPAWGLTDPLLVFPLPGQAPRKCWINPH